MRENLFIRNVDPQLYRRMRLAALQRGVRVGDLLNQAMELWLRTQAAEAAPQLPKPDGSSIDT